MDEMTFKAAMAAIVSGEYSNEDLRIVKDWLNILNKKEIALKHDMEKIKNEFVKKKDKSTTQLKEIHGNIKQIKNILKNL